MAMLSAGGFQPQPHKYAPQRVSLTLPQAIQMAAMGGLDPSVVHAQLPPEFKSGVEKHCQSTYSRTFDGLGPSEQRSVFELLDREVKQIVARQQANK